MAHKKAAWSAKNLRDSKPKYRWVKIFGGQEAKAWNVIIRQKGAKYKPGQNVYLGKDFSVHAAVDWVVSFRKKKFEKFDWNTYLRTVVEVQPK